MKVFLIGVLFLISAHAIAQNEVIVTPTKKSVEDKTTTEDTIVKPTTEQLNTTPKKDEPTQTTETVITKDPQLFGFHVDLNIPHILNYGVDYWHSSRWFSAAFNLGGYSQNGVGKTDTDTGPDLKISNQELAVRIHPFQGAFYLGAIYGQHTLTGSKTATYSFSGQTRTTTITDKISANYFTPHFGWLWKASYGLTFGMDFGYLMPANVSSTLDEGSITSDPQYGTLSTQPDYIENKRKIQEDSDKYGRTNLPFVALLRFGWLF